MAAPRNYINERLPYQLGFRPVGSGGASYTDLYGTYDYAFGGIPFLSAASNDRPMGRVTAQYKRDQFDNSAEPGEQSLTGWWLRSQSSFHLGAGLRFEDPSEETNRTRFNWSEGVDVWTPGEVSLLPTTTLRVEGGSPVLCHGAIDSGADIVLFSSGNTLTRVTSLSSAAVTWGGAGNILSLADDGTSYYAANSVGIYKGTLAGGAGSLIWNTGHTAVTIGWVKQRLMAGIGPKIYELTGTGPALPATALYTHPNSAWIWTSITEGPDSIYVSGYAGARSVILRLAVDTAGALPTLTQATTVAEMPTGEIIHAILGYVGTYLVIGTSKGVRVAQIGSNGVLEVGPLIETPAAVRALTGLGSHIYAGYTQGMTDNASGLLRIDLGAQLPSGRYAYARDLSTHVTGAVTGVTLRGASGVLAIAVDGQGLFETHPTDLEAQGTLVTYRIRYSTLWPKLYKRLSVRANPPYDGTIGISTIDQSGANVGLATILPDMDPTSDLTLTFPQTPQQHIALQFTLNRHPTDMTKGPTLAGYQLKSLPGGPRPRELTIPVQCWDYEVDRAGVPQGYDGFALERLTGMEAADSGGDLISFQNLETGESMLVLIERLVFEQNSQPAPNDATGGILQIICRTVD